MLAVLLSVGLLGCPDSADIATGEMRADFEVRVTDDDATVNASLYEGTDTFSIELVDGDKLVAIADGGSPVTLEGDSYYDGKIAQGTSEVKIELQREGGDNGSMSELVPEPIELDAETFSLGEDQITVTWANPIEGGLVAIFVDSCADISLETPEEKTPVEDTGSYPLTRAEIEAEADDDCAVLVVARRRYNSAASGFLSSSEMRVNRFERKEVSLTP